MAHESLARSHCALDGRPWILVNILQLRLSCKSCLKVPQVPVRCASATVEATAAGAGLSDSPPNKVGQRRP